MRPLDGIPDFYVRSEEMMRVLRWMLVISFLAMGLSAASCGSSEDATCGTSDDCDADQLCSEGVCRSPAGAVCNGDPDCPGGYQCVANKCERRQPEPDAGDNDNDATNQMPNNSSMGDMGMPNNNNPDNINPEVVAFSPADGTADVALDTTITVEFSEAMRETAVNRVGLPLSDGSSNLVDTMISYDAATLTATIAPVAPLRQATPYTITATQDLFDEASNRLLESSARFYTVFNEPTHHTELAETYAPVIYQDIRDDSAATEANGDIPTTVDFDGNVEAADNAASARAANADVRARIYYSVIESESHYFIHYTLYYAWRFNSADEEVPHDFTGIVVVVDKSTDEVILVEGAALRREEISVGFGIAGRGVNDISGKVNAYETMDASELIDGTRFPLYITPGTHEACAFTKDGSRFPVAVCGHLANTFNGAVGAEMRHGATGSLFSEATDTDGNDILDMTYELVPFTGTLWTRRADIGPNSYWEARQPYSPDGGRPDSVEGTTRALELPTRLAAPRDENGMPVESFGRPPFQWFEEPGSDNAGQWFLDPAFLLTVRYTFPAEFVQDYCYNPFLAIDRLDDPNAPNCATPMN